MQELYRDWDIRGAGTDLGHALEIRPSFAEARRHYSWYLRLLGQRNQSIEEMKHATALEPLVPQFHADLATLYLHEGRLDAALAEALQALEFDPAFGQGLSVAGAVYAGKHMYEEALAFHRKAATGDPAWKWPLGRTYALMGRKAEARAVAAEMQKAPGPMGEWGLAIIFSALGEKDEAFCHLERAYQSHFSWMPWNHAFAVPEQDLFATLRDDTRFRDLAHRVFGPSPSKSH